MNLDEAVQGHTAWKIKLAAYLRRPDDSIDQSEASNDHRCPLGQWLHGEAKKASAACPSMRMSLLSMPGSIGPSVL